MKEQYSRLFEEILKEATYSWDLNDLDRSWLISPTGEISADVSHRLMFKKMFSEDWDRLKSRGVDDGEIEEIFTNRLIREGYIKIGELKGFYANAKNHDQVTRDILQGFCKSILRVRPDDKNVLINIEFKNDTVRATLGEIADDYLMRLE